MAKLRRVPCLLRNPKKGREEGFLGYEKICPHHCQQEKLMPTSTGSFWVFLFNHRFSTEQIAALCTFLALLATPILGQDSQVLAPPSPCPTVLTYDRPGPEPGWWSGVITVSTDSLLHSVWLDIVLDSQAFKLLHKTVETFTENFKTFRIENEDMQIQPGIPMSFRFSVQYDTNSEVPRVQAIRLNGIVICKALSAMEQGDPTLKTNINSNTRLFTNPPKQSVNSVLNPRPDIKSDPVNISNTGDNSSERPEQSPSPRITLVTNPPKQYIYPVLNQKPDDNRSDPGKISNASDNSSGRREQLSCGTTTLESRWPWVVALYTFVSPHGYFCGGTLISRRHVITAAQCVYNWQWAPPATIDEKNLVVHLGKLNLSSLVGAQIRLVQSIIVSPDYVVLEFAYRGDNVALLVLNEPVTYSDWVRPACLWPANEIDQDIVIGKKGWLVGWGVDEKNDVKEQVNEVEMPVVSQETCIKPQLGSHHGMRINYYCAWNREATWPGLLGVQRGSGMVFSMDNSWYLRGHVAVVYSAIEVWEINSSTVLVDVAKSVPWIHSIVSNYV